MTCNILFVVFIVLASLVVGESLCPNWCNQRGICTSPNDDGYCICNYGYTKDDCSRKLCPSGFDPMTLRNNPLRRSVRIVTGALSGVLMGKIDLSFAGSTITLNADASQFDSNACNDAVRGLKSVREASCTRESYNHERKSAEYVISLNMFPTEPFMNNIINHNGNPSLDMFDCSMTRVDHEEAVGAYCEVRDEVREGVPVYGECALHGSCVANMTHARCACEDGFRGPACDDIRDDKDINSTVHVGPFFTASLLNLDAIRDDSPEFNLFQAKIRGENVTTITGDRRLKHRGELDVVGGAHFSLSVDSPETAVVRLTAGDSQSHHLQARTGQNVVFAVSAGGDVMFSGGLSTTDKSFSVAQGALSAQSVAISHSLTVDEHVNVGKSLSVGDALSVTNDGLVVSAGPSAVAASSLLHLRAQSDEFAGSLLTLQSNSESSTLIRALSPTTGEPVFALSAEGDLSLQKLRLHAGGVEVRSGGVQVLSGGLRVRGGLSLESGPLTLADQTLRAERIEIARGESASPKDVDHTPLLSLNTASAAFRGSLLSLSAPESSAAPENFEFIRISRSSRMEDVSQRASSSLFSISSSGRIDSSSGARFSNESVEMDSARLSGNLILQKVVVHATETHKENQHTAEHSVSIPRQATYVVIAKADGPALPAHICVHFETEPNESLTGRFVIVSNMNEENTICDIRVPGLSSVLFVHDGVKWVDIEALRAPMHSLRNVEVFTANNDLSIGNVTFTAAHLQSQALHSGSLVLAGKDGVLVEHDRLSFARNTLSAPAIRVERIISDVDLRGNTISHAVLSDSRLVQCDISAQSIAIPSKQGLAYFDKDGRLSASTSLAIDSDGEISLSKLSKDLNVQQHKIVNGQLSDFELDRISFVRTQRLTLSSTTQDQRGSVLVLGKDGLVQPSPAHALIVDGDNVVRAEQLSAKVLVGEIDGRGASIRGVALKGGEIVQSERVNTDSLSVNAMRTDSTNMGIKTGNMRRLVFANDKGEMHAFFEKNSDVDEERQATVHVPVLSVDQLLFSGPEIDLQGRMLKNVRLDPKTAALEKSAHMSGESLTVDSLREGAAAATAETSALVSANANGDVQRVAGLRVLKERGAQVLDALPLHIRSSKLSVAQSLQLPYAVAEISGDLSIPSTLLSIDESTADVHAAQSIRLQHIAVTQSLQIETGSAVQFADWSRKGAALLAVDASGKLVRVAVPASSQRGADGSNDAGLMVDLALRSAQVQSLAVQDDLRAAHVDAQSLTLRFAKTLSDEDAAKLGNVMIANKAGEALIAAHAVLDAQDGSLSLRSLKPVDKKEALAIQRASITASEIQSSTIVDSPSISTAALLVEEFSDLRGNVAVGGSLSVRGTVVGSGPYVDSSDASLKTNVSSLRNALELVQKMNAVTYSYKFDEFPDMNFPREQQVGFIAQELEQVLPQVVVEDSRTGTKAVAYAHTCAVAVQAIKELKEQHDLQLQQMQAEHHAQMQQLQIEFAEMKKILMNLASKTLPIP